jgi:3-isopropylmalate/(R)-2-methylmalate dehydratase large subunit
MGMTVTEKILAAHAGQKAIEAGDLVFASVDGVLANDTTCPLAIRQLEEMECDKVFDRDKVFLFLDHFTPNATVSAAQQAKLIRDFAREQGVSHFYDVGNVGIEHAFLPEQGLVLPGQLIIGGDSHTCTYGAVGAFSTGVGSTDAASAMVLGKVWLKIPESQKYIYTGKLKKYVSGKDLILHTIGRTGTDGALYKAMEFTGDAIRALSMDSRFTMCNMAIEAGAKNGVMEYDEKTAEYVSLHNRPGAPFAVYTSDRDAKYCDIFEFEISKLEPQVAKPHSPGNASDVGSCDSVLLDQVIVGSCTNGRIEDLRMAAGILKGKKVHPYLRMLVIPATVDIYRQMIKEGLAETFLEAGAAVSMPACGPCFGGHLGLLAAGEVALSTTNRNFKGRMGHEDSLVYLSGPAVAAASAVAGRIIHPAEVQNGQSL